MRPLVSRYVALSQDLECWLQISAGVEAKKIRQIYNGVDIGRFFPGKECLLLSDEHPLHKDCIVIGSIGRMQPEKDQLTLVRAFIALLDTAEKGRERLRLVLIGDGPLREQALALLREAQAEHLAWLPGARSDAPKMMRVLDIFVLPSLIEGVSNTILEAMATGLPVVATAVGGNTELVRQNETGVVVPAADEFAMSQAIQRYVDSPELRKMHGEAGRKRAEKMFSMASMVDGYLRVYDDELRGMASSAEYVGGQ